MNARGESIRELSELFRINRAGIPRPLLDRNGGVGGGAAAAAAAATAARMRMPTADGGRRKAVAARGGDFTAAAQIGRAHV